MGINVNDLPQSLISKFGLKAGEVVSEERLGQLLSQATLTKAEQDAVYAILNGRKNEHVGDGGVVSWGNDAPPKEEQPGFWSRIGNAITKHPKEAAAKLGLGGLFTYGAAKFVPAVASFFVAHPLATVGLLGAASIALLASCDRYEEPEDPFAKNEYTHITNVTIDQTFNIYNTFTLSDQYIANFKQAMKEALDENNSKQADAIANAVFAKIQPMFAQAVKDIQTTIDNNGDKVSNAVSIAFAQLMPVLKQMCGNQVSLNKLFAAFAKQYNIDQGLLRDQLKVIIKGIVGNNAILKKIEEQLEANGATEVEILGVLQDINDDTDKMKDIYNLLLRIEKLTKQGNRLQAENNMLQRLTIMAIGKLGAGIQSQLQNLIKEVEAGRADLQQVISLLDKLNTNVESDSAADREFYTEALGYLSGISSDTSSIKADTTRLVELAEQAGLDRATIISLLEQGNANQIDILNAISNVRDAVLAGNMKQDEANRWLQQIDADIKAGNKDRINCTYAMLNAINGLGNKISINAQKIVDAVKNNGQQLKDVTALLRLINDNVIQVKDGVGTLNDNVVAGNEALAAALAVLADKADGILAAIEKVGADNIAMLQKIYDKIPNMPDGQDYTQLLNLIVSKLDKIDGNNGNNFKLVLDALDKLIDGQKPPKDYEDILNKILQAIKDHKVTVDITGKITCECNCHGGNNNEGIRDLDDLDSTVNTNENSTLDTLLGIIS